MLMLLAAIVTSLSLTLPLNLRSGPRIQLPAQHLPLAIL